MTGTLFVVATPIGNLEDITLRALRTLREVDLVAAEDTRRTGNLLRHYKIQARLLSLHEHNERARTPEILRHLQAGRSVALVSDAGTPGISDPGSDLVTAARSNGIAVVPVPGPSAVTAALSVSGLSGSPVTFCGFPPTRSKDRKQWLEKIKALHDHVVVCFEAPHRLANTLRHLGEILVNRQILLGREVTKVHEQWMQGSAAELNRQLQQPIGEFVLLIRPVSVTDQATDFPSDAAIYNVFRQMTNYEAPSRREAVRRTAERLGASPKRVYEAIERAKK